VCGRTGVTGVVTSPVVQEQEHERDRAQTLPLHKVVTIVRGLHKIQQHVYCQTAQVKYRYIFNLELGNFFNINSDLKDDLVFHC